MVQQIVYTDTRENEIVKKFAKKWEMSKVDTIKKMIREFREEENEN